MSRRTFKQLLRYGVIGLSSNAIGYLLYLGLTDGLGMDPKLAMSLLYVVGVLQTFLFNRKWTFGHEGRKAPALLRYFGAYGLGYLVNLLALYLLVDRLGHPHQIVQAVMVFVLAAMLFMLQKFWVFRRPAVSNQTVMERQ